MNLSTSNSLYLGIFHILFSLENNWQSLSQQEILLLDARVLILKGEQILIEAVSKLFSDWAATNIQSFPTITTRK